MPKFVARSDDELLAVRISGERKGSERADVEEEAGLRQLATGAQLRSAEGPGSGREGPGFSGSLKQVLSFGCGLFRLRCSTCVVAPHLAWS